jgi:hypothetical protein
VNVRNELVFHGYLPFLGLVLYGQKWLLMQTLLLN